MQSEFFDLGVVGIGRNEGERLRACLASLREQLPPGTVVVYVDSGSTDGSVGVLARVVRGERESTVP